MKNYIVMRDCWYGIGTCCDDHWTICENMSSGEEFDSHDKAKKFIDSKLDEQKRYDYTVENFDNFCIFMAAADSDIYNEVEDILERYYYSRYDDVYVISQDLLEQPLSKIYIYYIVEIEVQ